MISISTSWNGLTNPDGDSILKEINSVGIKSVELGFALSKEKVAQIVENHFKYSMRISSVHNFCPVPEEYEPGVFTPDYFSLSSLKSAERRMAINLTLQSMHLAKDIGAKALIIHSGRVEMPEMMRDLIRMQEQGKNNEDEFKTLKNKMIKERADRKVPYLMAFVRSLDELLSTAIKLDLSVCIENRFYYREIPTFDEIGEIFRDFSGAKNLFYWHDVGHAQVRENLGLERHFEYLDAYSGKMLGMHLHDVKGLKDHQVPGTGDFNFDLLKPYIKKNTIKVLEVHQPATPEEMKNGCDLLEKKLTVE